MSISLLQLGLSACMLAAANPAPGQPVIPDSLEQALHLVDQASRQLTSYQGPFEYTIWQPLLESRTVRTGTLYYHRQPGRSALRVSFKTLQQDEDKPKPYLEEFLFDGVWLLHIDYQVKSATMRQMTEPNQPQDAFDLASQQFPLVGFSDVNELRRYFDVEFRPPAEDPSAGGLCELIFRSKPGSQRPGEYRVISFTLDNRMWLPRRVRAESVEGDVYQVVFQRPKVNQPLDQALFQIKPPGEFGPIQVIPLEPDGKDD